MAELTKIKQTVRPHERAARRRRHDRPGRRQRRRAVRRGRAVRRRDPLQARRRRPRRRRAVGQGGHRQADPVRLHRREARRTSSASTPTAWRSGSSGWATSSPSSRRPSRRSTRRTPRSSSASCASNEFTLDDFLDQLKQDPQDGAADLAARDDARARRPPAAEDERRRARARPRRGDHPLDDAVGAAAPRVDQGLAPPPHREGLGHERPAGQPAGQAVRGDAQADERPLRRARCPISAP